VPAVKAEVKETKPDDNEDANLQAEQMYEQAVKDGINPNDIEAMTAKYAGITTTPQPAQLENAPSDGEPSTPEETARAMALLEHKDDPVPEPKPAPKPK